jgi:hypothetical protein
MKHLACILAVLLAAAPCVAADEELDALKRQKEMLELKLSIAKMQRDVEQQALESEKDRMDALKGIAAAGLALQKAESAEDLSPLAALKDLLGAPKPFGKGGVVSFDAKSTPILLRSRFAGAGEMQAAVGRVCEALRVAGLKEVQVLPDDLLQNRRTARIYRHTLSELERETRKALDVLETDSEAAPRALALPAVVGGVVAAHYLVQSVADLARAFRSDRSLAISEESKEFLFTAFLCTHSECRDVIRETDPAYFVFAQGEKKFSALHAQLAGLTDAYEKMVELELAAERKLATTKASLKKETDKGDKADPKKVDALKARVAADTLALSRFKVYDRLRDAVATFLKQSRPEMLYEIAAMSAIEEEGAAARFLTYQLSTQDLQISKENAFTGQRLSRSSQIEIQYRVTDLAGSVLAAGYVGSASPEREMAFSEPEAKILTLPQH